MGLFSKKQSDALQPPGAESESGRASRRPSSGSRRKRNPFLENPVFQDVYPLSSHIRSETPDVPPPAYSPRDTSCPTYPGPPQDSSSDSPCAFLGQFDTVFLIDDSRSMAGHSWRETARALSAIAPICTTHDRDGIDVYFLNHRNPSDASSSSSSSGGYSGITSPAHVREIFTTVSPRGGTPTGGRLGHILHPYLKRLEATARASPTANIDTIVRPLNIIVITDGIASDDVESVIVNAARKLDKLHAQPWQVGVQFFQVGNEPEAAEELRELDDALADQKGVRDMVDTVPFNGQNGVASTLTGNTILKVVLGAVHRKYDRRSASGRRERSSRR